MLKATRRLVLCALPWPATAFAGPAPQTPSGSVAGMSYSRRVTLDRIVVTGDIDPGEWFDPTVFERLLPAASAITVAGVETTTPDLIIR